MVPLDALDGLGGVEAIFEDEAGTVGAQKELQDPGDRGQGGRQVGPIIVVESEGNADVVDATADRAQCVHHAFRSSSGAGGEHDDAGEVRVRLAPIIDGGTLRQLLECDTADVVVADPQRRAEVGGDHDVAGAAGGDGVGDIEGATASIEHHGDPAGA